MHPIRSPRFKAGLKFQQQQWKTHIHMEAEQYYTQWQLGQGRNKERSQRL